MGDQKLTLAKDPESRKLFLKHLLHDVEAIEVMLENNQLESGVSRIGAEQEFCLVDKYFKPSKNAANVLQKIDDSHFTSELARYNLEINLDPFELKADCFSKIGNQLKALQLHNGTIYKWNRPCYGISKGVPHLRIENRYLPSGPTEEDEIANLAFWVGLMSNMPERYNGNWNKTSFEDAKENFYKAAMWGIQSGMVWDGDLMSAQRLILEVLLPMAKEGLEKRNIDQKDIDRNLSIIEARAKSHKTGSRWIVNSFRNLKKEHGIEEAVVALTAIMFNRRKTGQKAHEWKLAKVKEANDLEIQYDVVSNIMSTDLVTVTENDLAELVLKIMDWRHIRHLPVEDSRGNLKGIITKKRLLRYLEDENNDPLSIASDVMDKNPVTIGPNDDIKYAMLLMMDKGISCLPVVVKNELIGIITDKDTQAVWEKIKKRNVTGN